ncbi:MAG: single-stranded DNA-binding protein [Odoribacter sp.]
MIKTSAIGTLGKNAEIKNIGGKPYASFSIAINEKRKEETKTTWVNCMKMDESGRLTPYLLKGTKVYVSGKPTISAYVSQKTNTPIPDMTIWVNELEFFGNAKEEVAKQQSTGINNFPSQQDDDLPF